MPLIPRDGGKRHRIVITEDVDPSSVGDWYEIKTALGYYDRLQASTARGAAFKLPANKLQRGEVPGGDQLISVTMDNLAEATHIKLMVWLAAWCHAEPISSATVRRVPESHAKAILDAIARYEADQGAILSVDSPLAGASSVTPSEPQVAVTQPAGQPTSPPTI